MDHALRQKGIDALFDILCHTTDEDPTIVSHRAQWVVDQLESQGIQLTPPFEPDNHHNANICPYCQHLQRHGIG